MSYSGDKVVLEVKYLIKCKAIKWVFILFYAML